MKRHFGFESALILYSVAIRPRVDDRSSDILGIQTAYQSSAFKQGLTGIARIATWNYLSQETSQKSL